jgi:hypothetical protein
MSINALNMNGSKIEMAEKSYGKINAMHKQPKCPINIFNETPNGHCVGFRGRGEERKKS